MTVERPQPPDSMDDLESAEDLESTAELPALDAAAFEPPPPWLRARARAAADARRGDDRTVMLERPEPSSAELGPPGELALEVPEARRQRIAAEQHAEELAREVVQARQVLATARAELDARTAELARLKEEIGGVGKRESELRAQLTERDSRIATLEQQVTTLTVTLTERDNQLRGMEQAEHQLLEVETRVRELETLLSDQSVALVERQAEMERLRASEQQLQEQLAAAAQHAQEQEAALLKQTGHIEALELDLARLRELPEGAERIESVLLDQARTRIEELTAALASEREAAQTLRTDAAAGIARERQMEADLRAAQEAMSQREAAMQAQSVQLAELEQVIARLRAEVEEARATIAERDASILKLKEESALSGSEGERAFAGTRLLVRTDGDTEMAHVLAARTSIGRSSDNDLQIDASSISRHHALILAGSGGTIIEDLHSTNGVRVNGRRITRQSLKDGDAVTIGKAQFRFVIRDVPEEG